MFAKLIKRERIRQGLTIKQLAQKCNLHWRTISAIEQGENQGRLSTINAILEALEVEIRLKRKVG